VKNPKFHILLALCLCVFATPVEALDKSQKTLVFAIDGLSFEAFQVAKARGLFPSFTHAGRHIAPYPSMTEPSWTEIMGGRSLFPMQGNAKTIEATYFSREKMEVVDDPRDVFNRYANPYNFMRAFDYYFNPFLEGLMYFPNEGINGLELEQIEKDAAEHLNDSSYVTYVSSVDAVAHTQKDQLFPLLEKVSATVEKVLSMHKAKGIKVSAWIVSDHGNEGIFAEGKEEKFLEPIDLNPIAAEAGLQITDKLEKSNQIAVPVLALANVANVYFKDLIHRRNFAKTAAKHPAVDLVTYLERDGSRFFLVVMNANSEAHIEWGPEGISYQATNGNPLQIPEELISRGSPRWISSEEALNATAKGPYPDSLFRLVQSATKQVENTPDLILNFKRGHIVKGNLLEYVNMVRTHGSLSASSSNGLLASNGAKLPPYVRSQDVMRVVGLDAETLFHGSSDHFHNSPEKALSQSAELKEKGIATRVTELSHDFIFRRINKVLAATMDFFTAKDIADFKAGMQAAQSAKEGDSKQKVDSVAESLRKIDAKQAINNIDSFLALKDIIANAKGSDEIVSRLKSSIVKIPGLTPLQELSSLANSNPSEADKEESRKAADALRRMAMKLYAAPYLLDEALNIPEFDQTPDPRNLDYAKKWHASERQNLRKNPIDVIFTEDTGAKLFSEIFTERQLFKTLYPATFPLLYNPPSQDITIVYVPGIYNELFDTEIFSRGLRALQENLGLRVLYAEVDGRCSSAINSQKILSRLKEDTKARRDRGYATPRYLILGYSKGGVDSLEMLLLDPNFTRTQIAGLATIASPLHGTTIVESADLPSELLDNVLVKPLPAECRGESGAKSMLRAKREAFLASNLTQLAELTRFYSVSFSSTVENSHPWMKITKNIARFQSPNDGVVTVQSSKFPEELGAMDLGTIQADHLAGILASKFPQGPFLEALVLTLFELDALSPRSLRAWHEKIGARSSALLPDYYKRKLNEKILQVGVSSGVIEAMGPFPEIADNQESADWYAIIARERNLLKSPIRCANQNEMSAIAKQIQKSTEGTPLELKPFDLRCENSKVIVSVETYSRPALKFWESNTYENTEVSNLEQLLEVLLGIGQKSGKNLLQGKEAAPKIVKSKRVPVALPQSSLAWAPDTVLDVKNLGKILGETRIQPILPENYSSISMIFDHQSMKDFRKEFGFFYEATAPGNMDDNAQGYFPVMEKIEEQETAALRLRSQNNSIRMTTAALRFKPSDFPNFSLKLKVNKGPKGADPAKGGSGKDDSAFQLWFNLRKVGKSEDRSKMAPDTVVRIFGYYWDEDSENPHPAGELFENYFSNKNFVIATLPEAWQISLEGGSKAKGRWFHFQRNLLEDIRRAYPRENPEDFEVVGITIQSDSNDTKSSSEAFFKEMKVSRE
jgi:hypothetical protein